MWRLLTVGRIGGVAAGQEFVGPGDGEAHEVLDEIADSLWRLIALYRVEAVMSCHVEGVIGRIDTEAVDVHHARHNCGRCAVGGIRRARCGQGSGQYCGDESTELHTDPPFRSRTIYVVQ